jgi:hypothetical protein
MFITRRWLPIGFIGSSNSYVFIPPDKTNNLQYSEMRNLKNKTEKTIYIAVNQ